MEESIIIYGRSNWKPGSLAIQARTLSRWSHVGTLVDGKIIEAVALKGVIVTEIEDFKARYSKTEFHKLPVLNKAKADEYLKARIGLNYDNKSILGFITLLGLDDLEAYHCAEITGGSAGYMNPRKLSRLTPGILTHLSVKLTPEELILHGLN